MDDPNITIEEYIWLEEEKAQKRGKVFNWETAKYGKIWYDEDVLDLISVETKFPAIVFNDNLTSNETPSCKLTISSLNDEIDFRILFDESDDEDYTVIFDKNLFSYKIISTNDLKTDSENDNEKVNKPLFPSPNPMVSCIDDLDFFKEFKNEFPAIVYNDALTSISDFSTEPTLCPQNIDEFDLKDETSLSEYDEVEQSFLYFNDLYPFNIVYPDNQKSDKGNDENEIDMIQSSGGDENTNKILKKGHDKIRKNFIMGSFIVGLNVSIMAWNHFVNGMLFNIIKNLYMPFDIPFDPKRYYKDGDYARMLRRLSALDPWKTIFSTTCAKIDVFKREITLRVGEEKIIFKSVKPASSLIKRVYMLSLRERIELNLEARLMGETLVLNRSLDPFFEDYIELNDLNVPLELRRYQVDDLMPTIEEGSILINRGLIQAIPTSLPPQPTGEATKASNL
ncbi:hypothetical protein Tco_0032724 [Tanacetum coccineum]